MQKSTARKKGLKNRISNFIYGQDEERDILCDLKHNIEAGKKEVVNILKNTSSGIFNNHKALFDKSEKDFLLYFQRLNKIKII